MNNPTTYYGVLALGVLAVIAGFIFQFTTLLGTHHTLGPIAFVVGAILIIGGIIGMFVMKPKSVE